MAENTRLFDIEEYANKARAALIKLSSTQQPGQCAVGGKADVVKVVKSEIKELMDKGYTTKQIAEAFKSDVFGILPKTITEIVEGKKTKFTVKKLQQGNKRTASKETKESSNKQATNENVGKDRSTFATNKVDLNDI